MSTETQPDNPPAFPVERYEPCDEDYVRVKHPGMTLRDYFAAQALMANIQRLGLLIKEKDSGHQELLPGNPVLSEDDAYQIRRAIAELAYDYADAMLAERSKP